jgi:hypothetical protein
VAIERLYVHEATFSVIQGGRVNEELQASFRRVVELETLAITIARELQAIEDELLALGIELYGEEFERFAERVFEDYAR